MEDIPRAVCSFQDTARHPPVTKTDNYRERAAAANEPAQRMQTAQLASTTVPSRCSGGIDASTDVRPARCRLRSPSFAWIRRRNDPSVDRLLPDESTEVGW